MVTSFYDGSARWIAEDELWADPVPTGASATANRLLNANVGYGGGSYMNMWSYQYASPGRSN